MRGAGDLLGDKQGGYVRVIGTALIPADYVPEPEIRIALYRRVFRLTDRAEMAEFAGELIDRFGHVPAPAEALVGLADLRLRCCALGTLRLDAGPKAVELEFQEDANSRRAAADLAADGAQVRMDERRLIVSRGADCREPACRCWVACWSVSKRLFLARHASKEG